MTIGFTDIGLAFVGGLILNVMPCVLPVLTFKVFHMLEQKDLSPAENRLHGLAYTAGVMVPFFIIAAAAIALKAAGEFVGWGMQFQNPAFVAVLTGLMVLLGLNALGVFEFTISMGGGSEKSGYGGSFSSGIIAAVMSTPCSAPFLGGAVAVALAKGTSPVETALVFSTIGLGLAFPFAMVSFVPALGRMLPRPGAWMETFKHLMGFTLLGAAVWLFGVLMNQVTADSANWFLAWLLAMGIGTWVIDRFGGLQFTSARRYGVRIAVLGLLVASGTQMLSFTKPSKAMAGASSCGVDPVLMEKDGKTAINWADFTPDRVQLAHDRQRPVFVDYTADWCVNCKTNEKVVLETDEVREALEGTQVLPVKADWTNEDELIGSWLNKLGRSAIPAYAIYMPDGTIDLLPEAITKSMVIEALEKAAEKYPKGDFTELKPVCVAAR